MDRWGGACPTISPRCHLIKPGNWNGDEIQNALTRRKSEIQASPLKTDHSSPLKFPLESSSISNASLEIGNFPLGSVGNFPLETDNSGDFPLGAGTFPSAFRKRSKSDEARKNTSTKSRSTGPAISRSKSTGHNALIETGKPNRNQDVPSVNRSKSQTLDRIEGGKHGEDIVALVLSEHGIDLDSKSQNKLGALDGNTSANANFLVNQ